MTQAPQTAPAGWYPSPDGDPVLRWWDGTLWTDATRIPAPLASEPLPAPADPGPPVSGWPAPQPPRLGAWSLLTRVLVVLAGVALPSASALRLWRGRQPPEWLTEDVSAGASGTAWGLLVVVGLAWFVWQFRAASTFPPGTTRRTPGWHVVSWLIPVAMLWLPYQNVADLFRRALGAAPRWLPVWWALWLGGHVVTGLEAWWPWAGVVGNGLLLAAVPFALLVVGRLTAALSGNREHPPA